MMFTIAFLFEETTKSDANILLTVCTQQFSLKPVPFCLGVYLILSLNKQQENSGEKQSEKGRGPLWGADGC